MILSLADNLIGLAAGKQDPADFWDLLRKMYNIGDRQRILFFTNKLYEACMKEGEDVSFYLMESSNLWNHLIALEESISNNELINIILNKLLYSYEMIIQGIFYMTNPTFKDVIGKILTKTQRMSLRN